MLIFQACKAKKLSKLKVTKGLFGRDRNELCLLKCSRENVFRIFKSQVSYQRLFIHKWDKFIPVKLSGSSVWSLGPQIIYFFPQWKFKIFTYPNLVAFPVSESKWIHFPFISLSTFTRRVWRKKINPGWLA